MDKINGNYLGVSKNSGTPKSSYLIGFSIINHPFWDTTIFGNTHLKPPTFTCLFYRCPVVGFFRFCLNLPGSTRPAGRTGRTPRLRHQHSNLCLGQMELWNLRNMGVSKNKGTPKSSILIGFWLYKPSILGYPYFRKHPYWYPMVYTKARTSAVGRAWLNIYRQVLNEKMKPRRSSPLS